MAAPTFVAAGSAVGALGALTVSWPATGVQANDIGLLFVETCNQAASLSTPSGFVEITNSPQGTGTGGTDPATRLTVFWCRATGTTMPDVVVADSGDHQVGRILVWRGCETSGNPWDVTAGDVQATASTAITNPSVTTTVADCLVLMCATNATDTATGQFSNWTNANLTGITLRCNIGSTSGNGGGIGVAEGTKSTAGATGTSTATLTTSSVQGRMTIALKPPQGSGATVLPDVGALTLTGFAPQIPQTIVAGLGQLTLTGLAPQVPRIVIPGLGQLTLTGFAPQIPRVVVAGLGQLTLTGFAPTVITSPQILPGTGQLVLTGLAPQVPKITIPGVGQLTLTGFAPQVPKIVVAGTGQLTLTGFAPQVPRIVVTGVGALTVAGFAPTVITAPVIATDTGRLILTGFAPTIDVGSVATPASGWRRVLYSEDEAPRRKRRRRPDEEIPEAQPLPEPAPLPPTVVIELPAELPSTPAARRAEARRLAQAVARELEEDDEEVVLFLMHLLADI